MEIVYDIKLNDGEVLKECYFIEYERKLYGGLSSIHFMTVPDYAKCFIDDQEVLHKNFADFNILKVYDRVTGKDFTELVLGKLLMSNNKNYRLPLARERVVLD